MSAADTVPRFPVKTAENTIWDIVRDAVVSIFVMEVVQDVQLFDLCDPLPFWLVSQMLDAVKKFVDARHHEGRRKRCERTSPATDQVSDRHCDQCHRGNRVRWRSEKNVQQVGILMVVEMDPLPERGCYWIAIQPAPMKDEAMDHVPREGIDRDHDRDGQYYAPYAIRKMKGGKGRGNDEAKIQEDGWVCEIRHPELWKGHLSKVKAPPCSKGGRVFPRHFYSAHLSSIRNTQESPSRHPSSGPMLVATSAEIVPAFPSADIIPCSIM